MFVWTVVDCFAAAMSAILRNDAVVPSLKHITDHHRSTNHALRLDCNPKKILIENNKMQLPTNMFLTFHDNSIFSRGIIHHMDSVFESLRTRNFLPVRSSNALMQLMGGFQPLI